MKLLNRQHRPTPLKGSQKSESQEMQIEDTKKGKDESARNHSKGINNCSIAQNIDGLLAEKTKLLYDHGVFTWNKSVLAKHKEINQKLEALGVYQGKRSGQIDSGCE